MAATNDPIFLTPEKLNPETAQSWARQQREAQAVLERFRQRFSTVLLADEVGMGKTYVALCVMARYVAEGKKVLLVVPGNTVLRQKWQEEMHSFNARYLKQEVSLRPLLVKDICNLLFNLHDYKEEKPERIRSCKLEPFALLFETWYNTSIRKAKKWNAYWPLYGDLKESDTEFQLFCAHFSKQSILAFLDGWRSNNSTAFRHLYDTLNAAFRERSKTKRARAEKEAKQLLRDLFRTFCQAQSTLSPNVFIITMETLRRNMRHDAPGMSIMKKYLAALALYHRRGSARERILNHIKKLGWADEDDLETKLSRLGAEDLWNLRSSMQRAFQQSGLPGLLEKERLNSTLRREADAMAADIVRTVFRARLKSSSLELAVVDEVHNWKNGRSNGALRFRENFADGMANRLIMSATPFQLHERELATVFETVCPNYAAQEQETDPSLARVRAALDMAPACLRASNDFADAWKNLPPGQQRTLNEKLKTPDTGTCLKKLHDAPGSDVYMKTFCARALSYGETLHALEETLRPVIIRHLRDKKLRAFHCGRDFCTCDMPMGERPHALYPVSGYGTGENALVSFVGMRAQQLLCRHIREKRQVHLLGGINSSNEAFLESWEKPECDDAATRAYVDLFRHMLLSTPHAKVEATVNRALDNLRHGRKTLIFCDRLATQKAIGDALAGRTAGTEHKKSLLVFGEHVVEYSLARSLISAGLCPEPDENRKRQALARLKKHALSRRQALFRLADLALAEAMLTGKDEKIARLLPYVRLLDHEAALSRYLSGKTSALPGESPERTKLASATLSPADASRLFSSVLHGPNLWHAGKGADSLHADLLRLLGEEAENLSRGNGAEEGPDPLSLADMFLNILQRLNTILPREVEEGVTEETLACALQEQSAACSSPWQRTRRFLDMLCREQGSILKGEEASSRRTLWYGLEGDVHAIMSINGHTGREKRSAVCALFNSPCFPDVLICTSIGSEGIDLHRECADVIHHDLPWNPALLEQRTGRVDRIDSLASLQGLLAVGVPFLAGNYDTFQYEVVRNRAQKQEILLGRPSLRPEPMPQQQREEASLPPLPEALLDFLRVDLSLHEA